MALYRSVIISMLLMLGHAQLTAQDNPLSFSSNIDTLMARLIDNPNNTQLQTQLIDAYLKTFNPEIALLEISYAEALGQLGSVGSQLKGRVQASLEQITPALKTLQLAYLQSPADETLFTIGILEYSRGNAERGRRILGNLRQRMPNFSVEMLRQYEQFYLNGRKVVARGIATAMQQIDPVSYETFFPRPQVSVLSPADNFSTEAQQTSVIFEVRHGRPVQSVKIKDQVLYDRGDERVSTVEDDYFQSFSQLITLHEGKNSIPITVMDVLGNESVFSLTINGISFSRVAAWSSPLADSLRRGYLTLRSYVPENELLTTKNSAFRSLVIAGARGADSLQLFDRGLLMHDVLTHGYGGLVVPANAKLLLGSRVTEANISTVGSEWLLKGATFQSVTIIYLAGSWTISPERWLLADVERGRIDLKPMIEQLAKLATAGIILLIDGQVDDRKELEFGLRSMANESTIPINVLLLAGGKNWPEQLIAMLARPGTGFSSGAELFSSHDLALLAGVTVISNQQQALVIAQSAAGMVSLQYSRMLSQLEQKLTTDRAAASVKRRILDFSRDWRRYNEVSRYLNNQLTLSDFIIRVDEYFSRVEAGRETN
jgi:hypothetical protein